MTYGKVTILNKNNSGIYKIILSVAFLFNFSNDKVQNISFQTFLRLTVAVLLYLQDILEYLWIGYVFVTLNYKG